MVVFTSWLPTRDAIGKVLIEAGMEDVAAPTGSTVPGALESRFKADAGDRPVVLVLSDRFSESIDLDGGNPSTVHHDLTWNPGPAHPGVGSGGPHLHRISADST